MQIYRFYLNTFTVRPCYCFKILNEQHILNILCFDSLKLWVNKHLLSSTLPVWWRFASFSMPSTLGGGSTKCLIKCLNLAGFPRCLRERRVGLVHVYDRAISGHSCIKECNEGEWREMWARKFYNTFNKGGTLFKAGSFQSTHWRE